MISVPDIPLIEVTPLYSYETKKLSTITTAVFCDHNMV